MSKYSVGLRNVGSYQISGTPWVTGSTIRNNLGTGQGGSTIAGEFKITFPKITSTINVKCTGGNTAMFLGFQSLAAMGVSNKAAGAFPAYCVTTNHLNTLTTPDNPSGAPRASVGYLLGIGQEITVDVGVKELYVWTFGVGTIHFSNFKIIAGLTNISTGSMYHLTGAGITTVDTSP